MSSSISKKSFTTLRSTRRPSNGMPLFTISRCRKLLISSRPPDRPFCIARKQLPASWGCQQHVFFGAGHGRFDLTAAVPQFFHPFCTENRERLYDCRKFIPQFFLQKCRFHVGVGRLEFGKLSDHLAPQFAGIHFRFHDADGPHPLSGNGPCRQSIETEPIYRPRSAWTDSDNML